jgi:hypothetical protein
VAQRVRDRAVRWLRRHGYLDERAAEDRSKQVEGAAGAAVLVAELEGRGPGREERLGEADGVERMPARRPSRERVDVDDGIEPAHGPDGSTSPRKLIGNSMASPPRAYTGGMREGERFEGYFGTGCGSDSAWLHVGAGERVVLRVRSRWMGRPTFEAVLRGARVAGDDVFGWLRVSEIALIEHEGTGAEGLPLVVRAGDAEVDVPMPDLPFPPIVEYIRRPASSLTLPDAGALATMKNLGHATWDEVWNVLLWIHPQFEDPSVPEGEDTDGTFWNDRLWMHALSLLDKRRLALVEGEP